ncbi:MAG: T9SS C-terminal target domain-containing protein [Cytophagales bacterium]|nr:MAG: T9SS C-terminal target domain-containing protein [Cytophagales bacterium]
MQNPMRHLLFWILFFLLLESSFSQTGNPNQTPCVGDQTIPKNGTPNADVVASGWFDMTSWNSAPYQSFSYREPSYGGIMHFRLMPPPNYNPSKKYPLIVMLHGKGEAGIKGSYPNPCSTAYQNGDKRFQSNDHHLIWGGKMHMDSNKVVNGRDYEAFVLFPQSADGFWGAAPGNYSGIDGYKPISDPNAYNIRRALAIIDSTIAKYSIDKNRVYLHGLSGGGGGTWELAYRRPELFAAVLPMCAGGLYTDYLGRSIPQMLTHTPVWITQGGADTNPVPLVSKTMLDSLRNKGNDPRYNEWAGIGHVAWPLTYALPNFISWIYSQNLLKIKIFGLSDTMRTATSAPICPGQTIRLGVNAFFQAYEWRKNGILIPGQTTNDIFVTETGNYTVRFRRGATEWTDWSAPVNIFNNPNSTPLPVISSNRSTALLIENAPFPNFNQLAGLTSVTLSAPIGMAKYTWSNGATTKDITVSQAQAGNYSVITQKTGFCTSAASLPVIITRGEDINLPAPSNAQASNITSNSFTITWTDNSSNELGFDIFKQQYPNGPYDFIGKVSTNVTSYVVTGLNPNTNYGGYIVRAYSGLGYSKNSGGYPPLFDFVNVTTLPSSDNVPPSVPQGLIVTAKSQNSITISWLPSTDNVGVTGYEVRLNGNVLNPPTSTSLTVFTATGLNTNTNYTFTVAAKDAVGNSSAQSNALVASITFVNGVNYTYHEGTWELVPNFYTEPVVKSGVLTNFSLAPRLQNDFFGFNFETYINITTAGLYRFYTNSDDGSKLFINSTLVVNNDGLHGAQTLLKNGASGTINLNAGYHKIQVPFFENGGGEALAVGYKLDSNPADVVPIPDNQLFILGDAVDNTPPSAPSGLVAVAKRNSAQLSWNASTDNVGVVAYKVYRNNTLITQLLGLNTQLLNLSANTAYTYQVSALDLAGNESTKTSITFTTNANTAPTFTPIADFTIAEEQLMYIPVNVSDIDGDNVSISLSNAPSFVSLINSGAGSVLIKVAPLFNDQGTYNGNTIVLNDNAGGVVNFTFNFTVSPKLPPIYWDGGAGTNEWKDANNWLGNLLPATQQEVILDHTHVSTAYIVRTNNANLNVRAIKVGQTGSIVPIKLFIDGSTTVQIADGLYNDLSIVDSGKVILNTDATVGNINLNNNILDIGNKKITLNGTVEGLVNAIKSGPEGTVIYNALQNQNIIAGDYSNLTIDGGATKTPLANIKVKRVLRLESGTLNLPSPSQTLTIDLLRGAIHPAGNGAIVGNLIVERTLNAGWHYITSPLRSSLFGDVLGNNNIFLNTICTYKESVPDTNLRGWIVRNGLSNLTPLEGQKDVGGPSDMIGYAYKFKNNGSLFWLSGSYTHGAAVSYNTGLLTLTNSGKSSADGWHLVGNPFPSPVNWNAPLGILRENLSSSITYYNSALGMNAVYTSTIPDSTNGASRYIPAMQAFWVQATSNNARLTIDNRARLVNPTLGSGTPNFYRQKRNQDIPRIKLQVNNGNCTDEVVVRFLDDATEQVDNEYDAIKFLNDDKCPSIYTKYNNEMFSINSLPINYNKLIPLSISGNASKFTITLKEVSGFDHNSNIYLEDQAMSTIQDLLQEPTYEFTTAKGDNPDRFVLSFNRAITDLGLAKHEAGDIHIYTESKTINIAAIGKLKTSQGQLFIYNALGQPVESAKTIDFASGTIQHTLSADGIYWIEVLVNGKIYTKKIITY